MDLNQILLLGVVGTASIIALTIAVTKGITEKFKVTKGSHKFIVTGVVALWLFALGLMQIEYKIVLNLQDMFILGTNFLVIMFGAMGIYNFIPEHKDGTEVL